MCECYSTIYIFLTKVVKVGSNGRLSFLKYSNKQTKQLPTTFISDSLFNNKKVYIFEYSILSCQMKNIKTNHQFYTLILSGLLLVLAHACGDDDPAINNKLPTITTAPITNLTKTSATGGGVIINDGGAEITAYGICWSTTENPTTSDNKIRDGSGTSTFTSALAELIPNTTYFVRTYAINSVGTAYGNSVTFKTLDGAIDADGNIYNVVKIGIQTWMKENLRTTKLNDGTPIPLLENDLEWKLLNHSAYCWYNNDKETYGEKYGALYKWPTVKSGKLCPVGWHVPSDFEWTMLTFIIGGNTLEGEKTAAPKLKAKSDWATPGSDEFGFSAYPGGIRSWGGSFHGMGEAAYWWCGYEDIFKDIGHVRSFYNNSEQLDTNSDHDRNVFGHSVRCIRDHTKE